MFFFIQNSPIVHTPSLVDIDLGIFPLYKKIQNPFIGLQNQPEFSQEVLLLYLYQHLLTFKFSDHKFVRIHLYYPLVILILTLFMMMTFPFRRKRTCIYHISRFIFYSHLSSSFYIFISSMDSHLSSSFYVFICSQVCVRSSTYPRLEGHHERKK